MGLGSVPKVAKAVGYTEVPAPVLSIAWVQQAKPPLLLVSLAPQTLLGLSPDLASAAQGGCADWWSPAAMWYSPSAQGACAVRGSLVAGRYTAHMCHMFNNTAHAMREKYNSTE